MPKVDLTQFGLLPKDYEVIQLSHGMSVLKVSKKIYELDVSYEDVAYAAGAHNLIAEKTGSIKFIHVADTSSFKHLTTKGISERPGASNELGSGIYVVDITDQDGVYNFRNLLRRKCDGNTSEKSLKVTGVYTGKYYYCEYDVEHEGYIVIPKKVIPSKQLTIKEVTVKQLIDCLNI